MIRCVLVLAIAIGTLAPITAAQSKDPGRVAKPSKEEATLRQSLFSRARGYMEARKKSNMVKSCWDCDGDGNDNGKLCTTCRGEGLAISPDQSRKVLFEYYSPAWQGRPGAADAVKRQYTELAEGRLPGIILSSSSTPTIDIVDATHGISESYESDTTGRHMRKCHWILVADGSHGGEWYRWNEETDGPWPERRAVPEEAVEPEPPPAPAEDALPHATAAPEPEDPRPATPPASRSIAPQSKAVASEERGFELADSAGLFVGVRRFLEPDGSRSNALDEVPFAVDDAIDLAHAFSIQFGLIKPDRVRLSLSGEPQKPESMARREQLIAAGAKLEAATYIGLKNSILKVSRDAGPRGLLVMTFATHGDHSATGDDWLLPLDTMVGEHSTALDVRSLMEVVSQSEAPRCVLLFDSCRASPLASRSSSGGTGLSPTMVEAVAEHEGMFALFAAARGGFSFDNPDRKNGVFTAAFLDGLGGAANADDRGLITLGAVADYVSGEVKHWAREHLQGLPVPGDIERVGGVGLDRMPLAQKLELDSSHEASR